MPVLTIDEARAHARDWESSDEEIALFITAAEDYVRAAVGENVPLEDARVKLLAGMIVADLDDVRGTVVSSTRAEENSRRELVRGLICQLRTEGLAL